MKSSLAVEGEGACGEVGVAMIQLDFDHLVADVTAVLDAEIGGNPATAKLARFERDLLHAVVADRGLNKAQGFHGLEHEAAVVGIAVGLDDGVEARSAIRHGARKIELEGEEIVAAAGRRL